MPYRFFVILSVILAAVFLQSAHAEVQLRYRLQYEPQTLDWTLAHTQMETAVAMNIMEGLVEFGPDLKLRPMLATNWSVSSDAKTYVFRLRPNVLWSDGKPLQAEDFVYSWQRLLDPMTGSAYSYFLFDIEGAEDFNARRITDPSKIAIKALDRQTLQVTLRKPVPYFLQLLTFWATFPMRKDVVRRHGNAWSRPGNTVVLGPFIPSTQKQDTELVLRRNDRYWGARPKIDAVIFKIISEDSTALNLFKSGQLDFVWPINFLELGATAQTAAFRRDPYLRTCFIGINVNRYPFNFPAARRAVALAIDKSKLPKILHLDVQPTDTLVPSNILPQTAATGLAFSPEAAKAELASLGIKGESIGKIEFLAYSSDLNALLGQYIQNEFKKNLGLNVEIQMAEYKVHRTRIEHGAGAMHLRCWGADYPAPDSYLNLFTTHSSNNFTGWKNARFDELIAKATAKPTERAANYKAALDLLLKSDTAIVPLYFDRLTYLLNPKVKGFHLNPLNYIYFRDVSFSP